MEPIREHAPLICSRCGHWVQRWHARECDSCPDLHCPMCDATPCQQKCGTCKGEGETLHMWERPGGPPGNGTAPCPDCGGTGKGRVMPGGMEVG